jgi:hypothetical protein
MSSLISDSPLVFSAQLAATIGLEEAIMLQALHDIALLQNQRPFTASLFGLQQKMPFWLSYDLQRVVKSLSDKGIIEVSSPPLTQTDTLLFAFESDSSSTANSPEPITPVTPPQKLSTQQGANRISANWQPDNTVLTQLRQHHNIPDNFSRHLVPTFVTYWRDRNEIAHSWNAKFLEHAIHQWQRQQSDLTFLQASSKPSNMNQQWRPTADAIEILQRINISLGFIEDAIPEFVLYWQERGDTTNTWNSKFIQHVKRQWERYTSALQHDTEPRRIPENWQPSPDVFDILKMATIDANFARQLIPEFVLYWKETNQLYSSWNTKFLQHVKYCWANQHLLRSSHEGQQNSAGTNSPATNSFIAKHTDRSWAEGL